MSEEADFFNNPDWRVTKLLLCAFGGWPYQKMSHRIICGTVSFIFINSILIPEIVDLIQVWPDIELMAERVPLLGYIIVDINFANCIINADKVKVLLQKIYNDYHSKYLSEDEIKFLWKCGAQNRKITNIYVCYIYSVLLAFLCFPIIPKIMDIVKPLNQSRNSFNLYEVEYGIDKEKYQAYVYLHAYIVTPFPGTLICAYDSLYGNSLAHACSMFDLMAYKRRLKSIATQRFISEYKQSGIKDEADEIYQALVDCVRIHQKNIKYTEHFQDTFSVGLLLILGVNIITLCITCLQCLLRIDELSEVIRFGGYAVGQIIHIFFLSYYGQKLMDAGENVYDSIYQSEWYALPMKSKKIFVILLINFCQPVTLIIGKLYNMSYDNFSVIIKTAVSYFMVLNSVREEN